VALQALGGLLGRARDARLRRARLGRFGLEVVKGLGVFARLPDGILPPLAVGSVTVLAFPCPDIGREVGGEKDGQACRGGDEGDESLFAVRFNLSSFLSSSYS
jgi:hypothetical protein